MSDREDKAAAAHVAAKDAYRNDRSPKNKAAKEKSAAKLIEIRNEERADRPSTLVVADTMNVKEV